MILCNGSLFVHIPKCAGTSIRDAMCRSHHCLALSPINSLAYRPGTDVNQYNAHMNPKEMSKAIRSITLSTLFTFTVVRNPWDRFVSWYSYQKNKTLSFDDFLRNKISLRDDQALQSYYFEDPNIYSYVAHFEDLERDWRFISNIIGITVDLPILNKSEHGHYRHYYTAETRDLVATAEKRVIDLFYYRY